jgi:hypothetical protein
MCKRQILLTLVVLGLVLAGNALAAYEIKVDLALSVRDCEECPWYPYAPTWKEGWIPWDAFNDAEPHDARCITNIGGSGINIGMGGADGDSQSVFQVSTIAESEPICNSWLETKDMESNISLVLGGDGLLPGTYRVYGYHNRDGGTPNMPLVTAETYTWGTDDVNHPNYACRCPNSTQMSNVGCVTVATACTYGCEGVVESANDIDVPILSEILDDNLEEKRSMVEFFTDGSPVRITYHRGEGNSAVLNAFIIEILAAPPTAYAPSPATGSSSVCPDSELSWGAGSYSADVNGHDLYFGTDFNDVNDANTTTAGIYVGRLDDPCYDPLGYLDFNETFYWRVDEVNDSCSPYLWRGTVWSFTVEDGKGHNPSPVDKGWSVESTIADWTPSCLATQYDLFWGDFNDANSETPLGTFEIYERPVDFGGLQDPATRYYWRIDHKSPIAMPRGDIWSYTTRGAPLMHYTFDGVLDTNLPDPVTDDSGNEISFNWGSVIGSSPSGYRLSYVEPNPLYNTLGTSAHFENLGEGGGPSLLRMKLGTDILDLDQDAYTIEMWVNQDSHNDNRDEDEDLLGTLFRKYDMSYIVAIGEDGAVRFAHSGDDNIVATEPGTIQLGEWYHIAAVFDSSDPCDPQKIYVSGIVLGSGGTTDLNPSNDDDPVTIGAMINPLRVDYMRAYNFYEGYIDELRVSDYALTPGEFLLRGDRGLAWLPRPYNGQTNVESDVNLIWSPGDLASSHDVYIGTDWDDVNDADTTTAGVYQGNVGPNTFDPGFVAMKTTCYWRVDEVNDSNGYVWKGLVWRFRTADFISLDDFESYTIGDPDRVYYTWVDQRTQPWGEATGAWLGLATDPTYPVHGGEKALQYEYNNNDPWADLDYSETWRPVSPFQDWTVANLKLLTLFFYGDSENDANVTEQLYVGIDDTAGKYAEMRYPSGSLSDLKVAEWQAWNIPLSYFTDSNAAVPNDLNFASVANVYIGFGNRRTPAAGGKGKAYFDDLRISLPTCVPEELKPDYDWSNNCIVDIADVGMMGEGWLRHDVNFLDDLGIQVQEPCDANLLGYWKLDEGSGTFAEDSSANDYHGTLEDTDEGNYSWEVPGKDGNAVDFSGGRMYVVDEGNTPNLRPANKVSVCAWIYSEDDQDGARVVVKGDNDLESYELEVDDEDEFVFQFRDGNDPNNDRYDVNGTVWLEEWIHVAGTCDGSTIACYVNGQLEDTKDIDNPWGLSQDPNGGFAIGNKARSDANDNPFEGVIDDVRVYDYGLSQAEVAWLATQGTGYMPLNSPYNIYYGEAPEVVNMKDFAVLMDSWLEEKLWPE